MSRELVKAMLLAGAKANDLWKIARTDVPPDQAVAELRAKYPDAFTSRLNVRELTGKDYEKAKSEMLEEGRQTTLRRIRDRNTEAALARHRDRK